MSVQQHNHNRLRTNPNYNIVQDSTKITYDTISLRTTTHCMNNENVPKNNSQESSETKIENSHHYIAELVENMPKYYISGKNYRPISIEGLDSYYEDI